MGLVIDHASCVEQRGPFVVAEPIAAAVADRLVFPFEPVVDVEEWPVGRPGCSCYA